MKKKAAVIGYGNIGQNVVAAINASKDFELIGVVRRNAANTIEGVKVVESIDKLGKVDVAIICLPSREVAACAKALLEKGINCVDSFDIHSKIFDTKCHLDTIAKKSNAVSIISAGWDPGSDSVIRALLLAIAPKGITYTNFGPGMSMGHSVCAKSKDGVVDAVSLTIPAGSGQHKRMVYVELENGANFIEVEKQIKTDPYFAKDDTTVIAVDSVDSVKDLGHGVTITRKGIASQTHNQLFSFDMRITNPAATAQVMLSCARAALKQKPGCYTMIELAPIDLLEGDVESIIKSIV